MFYHHDVSMYQLKRFFSYSVSFFMPYQGCSLGQNFQKCAPNVRPCNGPTSHLREEGGERVHCSITPSYFTSPLPQEKLGEETSVNRRR